MAKVICLLLAICILPALISAKCNPNAIAAIKADNHCKWLEYDIACSPGPDSCKEIKCRYQGFHALFTAGKCYGTGEAAPEGASCGLGFYCQKGECVAIPDWAPSTAPPTRWPKFDKDCDQYRK